METNPKFIVLGIVAVVTGGGSGIGRAMCEALAVGGARHVVVADIDPGNAAAVATSINQKRPGVAVAAPLDVSDEEAVASLVAKVRQELGEIDLWCSNAGINVGSGIGKESEWQRSIGVNLLGHVHAARALIPGMQVRKQGWFVVMASAAGLLSDFRTAPYTATKHAAVAFAEWLSITTRSSGVSVHCVCPEGVRTAMTKANSDQAAKGMTFLEADDVARFTLERVAAGEFLILPHPRVAEFELRRASDRGRWLASMSKAFDRTHTPIETH
jgi:NAD(P)-dependent dehydrogenase (short-subunit alcohol dehydrogenase family)